MSDFDKEAEREKLREKYGDEEEKRAATEQMSELLLKGATMTNAHCTNCGDPIFRYDGQEFCPTCQKPVARDQAGEDADGESGDHIEVADPSDDAHVQFGADDAEADSTEAETADDAPDTQPPTAESADSPSTADHSRQVPSADPDRSPAARSEPQSATDPDRSPAAGSGSPSSDDRRRPAEPERSPSERRQPPTDSSAGESGTGRRRGRGVASDLSEAESLLAETVNRFARQAADSEDPRTAREHLSAAREAAEALDAVRF